MNNILKAEYKKFFKSVSFKVIIGLLLFFPLFMAITYKVLESVAALEDVPIYGNVFNSLGSFMTSFNPVDNFGLIILIIILFIITNDFTSGTIRNKIIGGYSKNEIYLSSFIFSISIVFVVTTIYAFLTYFLVGISLGFGNEKLIDLLKYYVTTITSVIVVYSFINIIIYKFKSFGISLGIILGSLFIIMIFYSVISMGINENTNRIILLIMPFLQTFVPKVVNGLDILIMVVVNLFYISLLVYLGLRISEKEDYN
ncbi:MAG: hypothetical protein WC907_05385 [Acholeplasmataceae bacterium]